MDTSKCVCRSGKIEVICGPMFAEKTGELIRRLHRAMIAGEPVYVFAPKRGRFKDTDDIGSRAGVTFKAKKVDSVWDIFDLVPKDGIGVVAIDEAQWFEEMSEAAEKLAAIGFKVIVSGIDMDYMGKPFVPMAYCLAIAESVTKLTAVSKRCACEATHTARLGDKEGASGEWEPMCRCHWERFRKKDD